MRDYVVELEFTCKDILITSDNRMSRIVDKPHCFWSKNLSITTEYKESYSNGVRLSCFTGNSLPTISFAL
jgi:hypothetical protein